ncbi:hypothetical protein F5Y17DRAFT_458582 [Xylariaceae sp. FL0594]|nr:hypothetical protein F5Y17DRAFT_458582 [Xylariaceae sp. FL0594]
MEQEQGQTVLPKGIVLNRETIYQEIAKYDVLPLEQILRACHVFSTTSRTLYDPTARRLENFWTRMLGGDRRYLSGKLVALLFREISEETAFVKLRGPINRYEPPSPETPSTKSQGIPMTSGTLVPKPVVHSATPATKALHPILKKPSVPSASGHRPTARFMSPPVAQLVESSVQWSRTAVPAGVTIDKSGSKGPGKPAGLKEERKKGQAVKPKKKTATFAASASSRRRPAMPRRSSSQSSAGASDNGPKETREEEASIEYDGPRSLVATIPEKPEQQPRAEEDKGGQTPPLSAKAAGKRPVRRPQLGAPTSSHATVQKEQAVEKEQRLSAEAESSLKSLLNKSKEKQALPLAGADEGRSIRPAKQGSERSSSVDRRSSRRECSNLAAMDISRSASGFGRRNSREVNRVIMPPSSLTSSSVTKVDTSVGQGTIATVQKVSTSRSSAGPNDGPEAEMNAPYSSTSGLAPVKTDPPLPLERSKSQLGLLLGQKRPKQR